jgi:putative intracellular protease/amidase
MLEGDTSASGLARQLGRGKNPPPPLRIQVAAHVGSSFEAVVARVPGEHGHGHMWKLVRTFDDPSTWTEPGVRHLAADGLGGITHRDRPLPDQWELYDLTEDPIEARNRAFDHSAPEVFEHLRRRLDETRTIVLPPRNSPWPYAKRQPGPPRKSPPPLALVARRLVQRLGMHPDDTDSIDVDLASLTGRRALVVATNHGTLDNGKPTGVFSSEMTVPYYAFLDAGMEVDVASPAGGEIPVDPMSLKPVIRAAADDRFLADDDLRTKVTDSLRIGDLDMRRYDIVYLAGGWGAAFDFGTSEDLAHKVTEANAAGRILGGVCHGPLGFRNATATDGRPLVEGRRISAVTDKQVRELGIDSTPQHPETELRAQGALFESTTKFRDPLANHWVIDGNLVTGQNQNAGPMVAREMLRLAAERLAAKAAAQQTVPADA